MPSKINEHVQTLWNQVFKRTPVGDETALRVCADDTDPLPVTGKFTVAAPGPAFPTVETVTDVSAVFPSVNQADRATLSFRNDSETDNIYIVRVVGKTLAQSLPHKWTMGPGESQNLDFDDTNQIILVSDVGKTPDIEILEVKGP